MEDSPNVWAAISAIAAIIAAYSAFQTRRQATRIAAVSNPIVEDVRGLSVADESGERFLEFRVALSDGDRWFIQRVSATPMWKPLIARSEVKGFDDPYGGGIWKHTRVDKWARWISYCLPISAGAVFIRPGWSGVLTLCFELCLRSNSRVTSKSILRLSITD
ncbi:MAG TPA: hypothetical protein VG821_06930 [Rhizomicrobium sp.]|nr:hypothetical protein [Rhizomicrobium sp.]